MCKMSNSPKNGEKTTFKTLLLNQSLIHYQKRKVLNGKISEVRFVNFVKMLEIITEEWQTQVKFDYTNRNFFTQVLMTLFYFSFSFPFPTLQSFPFHDYFSQEHLNSIYKILCSLHYFFNYSLNFDRPLRSI